MPEETVISTGEDCGEDGEGCGEDGDDCGEDGEDYGEDGEDCGQDWYTLVRLANLCVAYTKVHRVYHHPSL